MQRLILLCMMLYTSAQAVPGTAEPSFDGSILPHPAEPYTGTLAPTEAASTPRFPTPNKAPGGAPNILLVMTDDVGFAAASTFGGPVPTPHLDHLALQGLRYNHFHTTGICSPTRAVLLTGRNHHAVGAATVVELESPYPGYTSVIPRSAATIARILRDNGYSTAMFGKDHNVPSTHRSMAGPFEQWPTGRGFDYFYGFVGGDSDQWRPALFEGTQAVSQPLRDPEYLLDKELADRTIYWLHNQQAAAPGKPFFIYYAPGTAHAPQQAPAQWIAKFRGMFDHGWDAEREQILARQKAQGLVPDASSMAPRPEQIPAWSSLTSAERKVHARYMEVFAAALAYQDQQIGRVLAELQRMGIADNTLVMFIQGDNGASGGGGPGGTLNELAYFSSEAGDLPVTMQWLAANLDLMGGPDTYQGIPIGWAYAMSAPFPWVKQIASHLGGVRNGLVVRWPEQISSIGELRPQYHHVVDIMPTLLEAARVTAPATVDGVEQQRIDGVSMIYSFDAADAASKRQTQYYEIMGNRAIYHDGWLANTSPRNMPWHVAQNRQGSDTSTYTWELYNLHEDFSQAHNLVTEKAARLRELQAVFDTEARRNQVYPIQDSGGRYRAMRMGGAGLASMQPHYIYWGRDIRLPMASSPPIFFLPFSVQTEIHIPPSGADGVLVAAGSQFGGWSFYLSDGKPVAVAAVSPLPGGRSRIAGSKSLTPGKHTVRFDFMPAAEGGELGIFVDGIESGRGSIARRPHIMAGLGETFDTGRDSNVPVSNDYRHEGVFSGDILRVDVKVTLPGPAGAAAEAGQH